MGRVVAKKVELGFTILELLVVIAVIALLFALLVPALQRARTYSTHSVCMHNLMQYVMAGQTYLEDNDKRFPGPNEWLYSERSVSNEHPIGCRWHDREMSPYGETMKTMEQYRGKMWKYFEGVYSYTCPIFRDIARSRGCENPEHNKDLEISPQYSYTMNGYLGSEENGGVRNESEVRDPAKVFFFAEENSWSIRPDHPKFPVKWLKAPLSTKALDDTVLIITPTPEARDCFATYHGAYSDDLSRGAGNVAFVDGHVESVPFEGQLRAKMHGVRGSYEPAGNMAMGWASKTPPPGGWDGQ
jgi:prepilin-type processing-associated H-X9-DG protein/prepilin-type N-terminal cleavage/methylation domain-containing protein